MHNQAGAEQIAALKAELSSQGHKSDDLIEAMGDWAKANGFAIADANSHVRQWAEEIKQRKQAATGDEKALAELALKHYGVAAQ